MEKVRLPERFMSKVNVTATCWLWIGATMPNGYGRLTFNKKDYLVHRFVWEFYNGSIPKNMYICHKCDIPNCVNPDHLFLGTSKENHDDMKIKGRSAKGEGHGRSKLTEEQVKEIRSLYPEYSQLKLAKKYGVSQSAIFKILHYKKWSHI